MLDKLLVEWQILEVFWIALATQLSAPVSTNISTWFNPDDMPGFLISKGTGLWQVGIRLNVAPDGKLQSCEIESTSNLPDLDKLTCRIASRRAKFQPARWADGSAAFGVYRTTIKWTIANSPWDTSNVSNPDIDLSVDRLPSRLKSPALVRVMFAVDEKGIPSSCAAEPSSSLDKIENDPALVRVACDQILKSYKALPAKNPAGAAIPSIQDALIRFFLRRH